MKSILILSLVFCSFVAQCQIIGQPRWQKSYIDVLNRAITDGVATPSYSQKVKHSGLIARHIRSGLWSVLDVYYNFRQDAAEPFNYYNWKTAASNKITKVGTTTFTSNTKVAFQGTAGYYNTNFPSNSGSNYALNSGGIGAGIIAHSGQLLWGSNAVGVRYILLIGATTRVNSSGSDDQTPTSGATIGKLVVRRISSTQISWNKNGVADGVKSQAVDGIAINTVNIYLGARNNNGVVVGSTGAELSYWWIGQTISDALALQAYNDETAFEAGL